MKLSTLLASAAVLWAGIATAPQAQVLGFVTTQAGSLTNSIGSAISKVATEKAGIRVTVQVQQSNGLEPVNAGTAEFGLSNSFDMQFFTAGIEDYAGKGKKENIRIIGRMVPLMAGVMVRKDSDIKTLKELKGKRIGAEYGAQRTIHRIFEAYLANAGLTYDDVQKVPARNVVNGADDFAAGKTAAFTFALGAAKVKEVNTAVGGLRTLAIDPSPEAVARMRKLMPGSYPYRVTPSPRMEEVTEPVDVIGFDLMFFTGKHAPEETIYKITKAVHDNKDGLVAVFAGLNTFDPKKLPVAHEGLQFHPGAEKFYKEAGMWPPRQPGA